MNELITPKEFGASPITQRPLKVADSIGERRQSGSISK